MQKVTLIIKREKIENGYFAGYAELGRLEVDAADADKTGAALVQSYANKGQEDVCYDVL